MVMCVHVIKYVIQICYLFLFQWNTLGTASRYMQPKGAHFMQRKKLAGFARKGRSPSRKAKSQFNSSSFGSFEGASGDGNNPAAIVQLTYTCSLCGATYDKKASFQKQHLGQLNYSCDICGKSYSNPNNLEGHVSVHTKRKLFKCPMCNADFAYKQSFKVHLKQKHKLTDEQQLTQIISSTKGISSLM